jgi:hypothetical protein
MSLAQGRLTLTFVAVLSLGTLSVFTVGRAGQEELPPAPAGSGNAGNMQQAAQRPKAVGLAMDLITGAERHLEDAPGLAARVLPLSPEQREHMGHLSLELAKERSRLLAQLSQTYAEEVREALTAEQAESYDGVLGVLRTLEEEAAAARREFLESLSTDGRIRAEAAGRYIITGDATDFLDLSEEKRSKVRQLRAAMRESLRSALQQRVEAEDRIDLEAWRERRTAFREATERAQAEFEEQLSALLSPEQRERLAAIEAAAERHNGRIREARRKATADLLRLLQATGE